MLYTWFMCTLLTGPDQTSAQRYSVLNSHFSTLRDSVRTLDFVTKTRDLVRDYSWAIRLCDSNDSFEARECQTFHLESLIQSLQPTFDPLQYYMDYRESILDCRAEMLMSISKMSTFKSVEYAHKHCSPGPPLSRAIASLPTSFTLTAAQDKRLAQQALRSGVETSGASILQ